MSTIASLDRIGVGIDTARYGHRVSFLRPDRKPAAKPLTVMENRAGYQALQVRINHYMNNTLILVSTCASMPPVSTPSISNCSYAALSCP